jgi:hypothetical protein
VDCSSARLDRGQADWAFIFRQGYPGTVEKLFTALNANSIVCDDKNL